MARHITDLDIGDYRGLKDLCLQDCNDINILTGNNNSGKTSVLEVLSGIGNPESILTWVKMCRLGRSGNYYAGMLNLFPVDSDDMAIRFAFQDSKRYRTIELEAKIREERISAMDIEMINGHDSCSDLEECSTKIGTYYESKCLHLEVLYGLNEMVEYDIYDFQTRIPADQSVKKSMPIIYVSPSEHTDGRLLLDEVMESPALYQELMKILRKFDDSIMNITKSGNAAEYIVLSTKHKKAVPLSAYGDGMKKALVLLAAVVKAKDGILLLDEFETAIHTSAMNSIFSWILQSAQTQNVQVFLTSHSLEAIGKVLRCDPELQDKINLYTLYNKEGENLVRKMSCMEAVEAQNDWGVELR